MNDQVFFKQIAQNLGVFETDVEGSVGWASYILFDSSNLPTEISLIDSLNRLKQSAGCYVFAHSRPEILSTDPTAFFSDVKAYVEANVNVGLGNRAMVWLQAVKPLKFGDFKSFGINFKYDPITRVFEQVANLNVSLGDDLVFNVLSQLIIGVDEEKQSLYLSTSTANPLLSFQKSSSDLGITISNGSRNIAWIPVSGSNTGSMVFTAEIKPDVTFLGDHGLDVGFKYTVNLNSMDEGIYYDAMQLSDLPPLLYCIGAVDPSDPVNSKMTDEQKLAGYFRCGFSFLQQPELTSTFRSIEGQTVSLVPLTAETESFTPPLMSGSLVFASSSAIIEDPAKGDTYLSLAGKYAMSVAGQQANVEQQLLCGLFGTEKINFSTYDSNQGNANDALFFLLSQAAYAPVFPFEAADLNQPNSGAVRALLSTKYLTSWATIFEKQHNTALYSSEPDGSSLYGFNENSPAAMDTGEVDVLFSAPPTMPLPQGSDHSFPMVPYGQLTNPGVDGNTLTQFESEIISAKRKKTISNAAVTTWQARKMTMLNQNSVASEKRTTPQGFVADVADGAYLNVAMAQSLNRHNNLQPFSFQNPTLALQDALQTNQLFLVGVNDLNFGSAIEALSDVDPVFNNTTFMAGWKMSAQVGKEASPTSYKNVIIFKFCDGALVDRVTNPNRWTNPQDFSLVAGSEGPGSSLAYTGLSQWLQNYIQEGIARADGPSAAYYQNFKKTVTDPNWKGVMVFEANLSTDDMPPEIQGLAAGIDFSQFSAHHFGFTVSRVSVNKQTNDIQMQGVSSLFGLVDYQELAYASNLASGVDPNTPIPIETAEGFDFTVLQLQSLFENAQLKAFQSRIQLTVNQLFDSPTVETYREGEGMPVNAVVLDGSYIDQNGEPSYVFQQTQSNVFTLDSNVLQSVLFSRVQFNTLGPVGDGSLLASRFLIWGAFDFVQLNERQGELLDVLSFGSPANTEPAQLNQGLAFSNLLIDMTFPLSTPTAKIFTLVTNDMAYDLNASTARNESLFEGFGLELKSFVNAKEGETPADYGYLPVGTGLNLSRLQGPWFGVEYEITLGGPGALASAVGFNSNLLMAWSPSTKTTDTEQAVFIGLSLPGASPGASLFSIEGIFKVAVGAIALLRQNVAGDQDKKFYCLRLDDIGIKIFGIVKLPPDANIQFFLFGDPNNTGAIGWYAAYVAQDNPGCDQQQLGFVSVEPGNLLPNASHKKQRCNHD